MIYGLSNNYGWSYGMMSWLGGGIMMVAFSALFIGIIVWVLREISGKQDVSSSRALDILKERYAKGEIDKKEFEERKKDLAS